MYLIKYLTDKDFFCFEFRVTKTLRKILFLPEIFLHFQRYVSKRYSERQTSINVDVMIEIKTTDNLDLNLFVRWPKTEGYQFPTISKWHSVEWQPYRKY
jgi:hypothetical protein